LAYDVGDATVATYEVRDDEGTLTNADTVVLTVTKPDLTTDAPTVANPPTTTGEYEAAVYLFATAGRYRFRWVTTNPNTAETFVVDVIGTGSALPTLAEVKAYLDSTQAGLSATYSDPVLTDAIAAETAAQARKCRVLANYPDDLRQALYRRVQRNLAMRGLPLAVLQGDAETGSSAFLPGNDPEVRRLEGPHRKLVAG
jgi:hypothetical protein